MSYAGKGLDADFNADVNFASSLNDTVKGIVGVALEQEMAKANANLTAAKQKCQEAMVGANCKVPDCPEQLNPCWDACEKKVHCDSCLVPNPDIFIKGKCAACNATHDSNLAICRAACSGGEWVRQAGCTIGKGTCTTWNQATTHLCDTVDVAQKTYQGLLKNSKYVSNHVFDALNIQEARFQGSLSDLRKLVLPYLRFKGVIGVKKFDITVNHFDLKNVNPSLAIFAHLAVGLMAKDDTTDTGAPQSADADSAQDSSSTAGGTT